MATVSFRVEENLKDEIEALSANYANKQEFVLKMLQSLRVQEANEVEELDFTAYNDIENQSKKILADAFKHIIYTLQASTSTTKQQALALAKEKQETDQEREAFQTREQEIRQAHNEQLLQIQEEAKAKADVQSEKFTALEEVNKELEKQLQEKSERVQQQTQEIKNLQAIAEHTQSLREENQRVKEDYQALKSKYELKSAKFQEQIEKQNNNIAELEKIMYKRELEIEKLQEDVTAKENIITELKELEITIKQLEKENTVLETKLEMLA